MDCLSDYTVRDYSFEVIPLELVNDILFEVIHSKLFLTTIFFSKVFILLQMLVYSELSFSKLSRLPFFRMELDLCVQINGLRENVTSAESAMH